MKMAKIETKYSKDQNQLNEQLFIYFVFIFF